MSKKKAAEVKEQKLALPTNVFEAGEAGKFRFKVARFRAPGFNEGQPITALEALKNPELLAHLVEVKSQVIEKVVAAEGEEG